MLTALLVGAEIPTCEPHRLSGHHSQRRGTASRLSDGWSLEGILIGDGPYLSQQLGEWSVVEKITEGILLSRKLQKGLA